MMLITSKEIDYDNVEALRQVFLSNGLNAVTKGPEGYGNAMVEITFPSTEDDIDLEVVVMVWVPSRSPEHLTFRVVLFDRKERDSLKKNDILWKDINRATETLDKGGFGALSLSDIAGIISDYTLTIEGGIAWATLNNTAKEVANFAQGAKEVILDEISFADPKE